MFDNILYSVATKIVTKRSNNQRVMEAEIMTAINEFCYIGTDDNDPEAGQVICCDDTARLREALEGILND